jgi:autotransporter-associated beta strand protein
MKNKSSCLLATRNLAALSPASKAGRPSSIVPRLSTRLVALLALASLSATLTAHAAQRTWSGGGGDNNWGTAANWGGTFPVPGDSIVFAGSTRTTNFNNLTTLNLTGISFNNSGFLFGGSVITNSGGIYDNSGNNTNNLLMCLSGSQGITNAVPATVLQLGGVQTNMATGNVLTFGGPGNIYVNGVVNGRASVNVNGDGAGNGFVRFAAANVFAGPLAVNSGTLQLANGAAIPSGNGNGDVTNNATIDLNGNSQTINGLYGNSSGVVDNKTGTGTYTLTVGNNATNQGGNFEFDGVIQNTSGNVALTKINTNVFYLNSPSADNYNGATTVNGGKLILGANATIPNSATITVAPGAQLDVSAQTSLAIGASQALYAGRSTNGAAGDILGSVDNSGKLVILNPAVAGTLTITNSLTLESGSTVTFDLANTNTVGAGSNDLIAINGTLGLNGGTIQLNPYVGTLATGAYGTYTLITNSQAFESGTAANMTVAVPRGVNATLNDTTFPGSLLVAITGSGVPVSLVWDGTSGASWDVQSSQNWLNGVNPDYFYYLDNVVFNDVGNGNVNVATGVSPSSTVFNNSPTNAYALSGPGSISGSGSLTINNGGTVTLNISDNYTGNTVVNYGNLLLGNYITGGNNYVVYNGVTPANLVLGNGGVFSIGVANQQEFSIFNSLVLHPGGSTLSFRNRQSNDLPYFQFNNAGTRSPGGTLDLSNIAGKGGSKAGVIFTGQTFPNGILGGYATWSLNDWVTTNLSTVAGVLATNYNLYQVSATPSAWGTASNVNLTASTTANISTATINSLKISALATATINAGNTLTLTSGGILIPNNTSGAATITGGTLLGAPSTDLIVLENAAPASSLTIVSTIADNGGPTALTKAGQGTLILTGTNTYSGVTYINGATIAGGNQTAAPLVFNPAGILQVGAGGVAGNLGNTTAVTNYGTLAYNHSDNVTLNIPINGPGGLKQLGSGVLTLTANSTYSGATTISAGTLQVGAGTAAGSLGSTSAITNNATLVIDRPDAVVINGPISGVGTLVNLGAGSLTLNSSNSYAGLTTISNGTVALGSAASIPLSSGIVLSSSGSTLDVSAVSGGIALSGGTVAQVLAGYGTVNGSVIATNNTTITPGTNGVVGTLTINNNLTLAGGTLKLDVGSSTKDLLTVGGALNFNSGSIVLNTLNTLPNSTYKLISYGSFSGAVANLSISGFSQGGQLAYVTNNATAKEIDLVVFSGAGASLTWVGDGANNFWDVNTSPDWNNGAGASVFHNNDNVTFNDTSANPGVVLNAADAPASMVVNTLANNYTFSGSGSIAGGGSIVINATNTTVTVTAPFNNSGQTVINTGTVQVGDGSTQGQLGIGVVTNNGVLNFNEPVDTTFSGSLAGSGMLFQQASTMLILSGNNNAYTGPVTINGGVLDIGGSSGSGSLGSGLVTNNGSLLVDRTGNLTLNNNITGSGPVAFVAGGTVTYGGNNTYANNTYISNGVVKLGSSTAIFSDGGAGDWLILDGNAVGSAGTLDLNGHDLSVNAVSGLASTANGLIENNGGSGTNTLAIIGTATTTYSGTIQDNSGSGGKLALLVNDGAVQTLDVESAIGNTFTGGTVISNATVHLVAGATIGNPVGLGTGPVTLYSNAVLYAVGNTGSTTPTWNSLFNNITIPAGQSATIRGPARGTVGANIFGGGTLTYIANYVRGTISGNWSAFTGQIIFGETATGGNLGIGSTTGFGHVFCTNDLGTAGAGTGVYLYNTVAGTPTIAIGELADDGSATIESTTSGNAGGVAANFAVGGLNTSTNFGGNIIDNVGIIKVGLGTWTLTGATLTYSGQTTVSNGVLALGASTTLPNSTPITLAAAGTLDVSAAGTLTLAAQTIQGNGKLNGSLATGSGTTVSPGGANAIGTLTVTNDVNLAGTIIMELNRTNSPATNDLLVATTIEAGGTLQVNNLGPDLHTGDTFKLFSVPVTGAFTATNLPVTTGNGSITYVWTNKLAIDGTIQVLVGVPNVNTNPPPINYSVSGNTLSLSWPTNAGWTLQAQTNGLGVGLNPSAGNWVIFVPGSSGITATNITIDPTKPTVFYRLVYP